ncbi:hypothetical protein PVAND_007354 [Polypedilum vanderplanki]|uniref:dolichyl-phosphate-mannose--protein mannosyltransferase n=1 Tax=Polypedilum vanderplanki TaxID=319348 RepID=A0A9J6C6F6_POLVA|nr:hypothetical protein PVAND_007354 [Polypedilum vanderplanki]
MKPTRKIAQPREKKFRMDYVNLGCCVLAFVLYFNTLKAGFVYDDRRAILANPDVTGASQSWYQLLYNDFWGTPLVDSGSHGSYRPLCVLSYKLNHIVGGLKPFGYHLINVLLHCLATGLVVKLARHLLPNTTCTAITGLLFASHPVHSEAVAGIVGRADLIACNFYILTILSYIKHVQWRKKCHLRHWMALCAAILSASAAVLSKETAVSALIVCVIYDILKGFNMLLKDKHQLRSIGILGITILTILHLRLSISGPMTQFSTADNPTAKVNSLMTRFYTFLYLPVFNFNLLIYPQTLSFDWGMDAISRITSFFDPRNFVSIFFYFTLSYVIWKCIIRLKESSSITIESSSSSLSLMSLHKRKVGRTIQKRKHQQQQNNNNNNNNNNNSSAYNYNYAKPSESTWTKHNQLWSSSENNNCYVCKNNMDYHNINSNQINNNNNNNSSSFNYNLTTMIEEEQNGIKQSSSISLSPLKKYIRNNNNIVYSSDDNNNNNNEFTSDNNNNNLYIIDNHSTTTTTMTMTMKVYHNNFQNLKPLHMRSKIKEYSSRIFKAAINHVIESSSSEEMHTKLNGTSAVLISITILILPFLPATNLFFYVGFVVAERILYLPSVGYCLLIGLGLGKLINSQVQYGSSSSNSTSGNGRMKHKRTEKINLKSIATVLCVIVMISAFCIKTVKRNRDWYDEESLYRSAVKVNPPKALGNLGSVLSSLGRNLEAEKVLIAALKHRPNMADVHYNLGILYQNQQKYENAVNSFQKAIHFRPTLALAYLNLGTSLIALGRCHEAASVLRDGTKLDGTGLRDRAEHENARISSLLQLGGLYTEQGKLQRALAVYREALYTLPSSYPPQEIYHRLGDVFFRLNKWPEAERFHRAALDAGHIGAHISYGTIIARNSSRSLEAEQYFKRAIRLAPLDSSIHHHYAEFLTSIARHDEACRSRVRAAELSPSNYNLVMAAASALRSRDKKVEAEKWYRQAAILRPNDARAHTNLGAILHLLGRTHEAILSYKVALNLQPNDPTTLDNLRKLKVIEFS